jgi:hypothetical protein
MTYRGIIAASALAYSATLSLALAQGTMTGEPGNWTVHTAGNLDAPASLCKYREMATT